MWSTLAVVLILLGAGTWVAVDRITTPLAKPVPHPANLASVVVTGASPMLPWPVKGQGAIAVPSIGYTAQSGPESSVPIASLTKLTTAVVILRDHPLAIGADGPVITVTAADAAEYQTELHSDESSVDIEAGETLTERQLLEGLLTQSANDMAFTLAMWDAGSIQAFVVKMNALATSLGTTNSHYVDASGYDPQSVSSASDVLRIATAAMAIPTFAQIVNLTSVSLPLVGTLHNIVSEIGVNGVVGIKSGYTSSAGACMVLASYRTVEHRQVLVLVAVLGQPTPPPTMPTASTTTTTGTTTSPTKVPLTPGSKPGSAQSNQSTTTTTSTPLNDLPIADPFKYAGPTTVALLAATEAAVAPVEVATAGEAAGTVTVTWGGVPHVATVVIGSSAWLPGWPGQTVDTTTRFTSIAPGSPSGTKVGVRLFAIGSQFEAVALRLDEVVPEPSTWWRLVHA
jgi:serine-type D-Ala-D-Ala carboxypeptidase (penicillin-binding protein 5/6)